ncbi:TonB-dependent receptor plug domain-containing protein [Pedobacter chitinilyticus]|uniref:TonB-dependent receptor n=1 Tax=Pedobacter chitinilyticus TaxID=2233776 RepID=A0A3S3QIH5_9SPHI|nr:TonB-dependent receptor [Pedobacter chitinilyticus]RWU10997.1 TonB-dependent receptor [Pedobacter chitinilyticus]
MKRILLSILTLTSTFTFAQENKQDTTKLNEIIISENRLQTPFSKQARNIQLITKEQIAQMPVKSINEVLSFIAGADVRQRGPFGTQADISIDGGSFEQTLILLNGVKISDVQTAHHSMNIPVPLSAIERIEVLKGPAARVYGINALTGAINIVTKASKQSAIDVNLQAGSSFDDKAVGDGKGIYGGAAAQVAINMAGKNSQHLVGFGVTDYNGQRYNSSTYDHKFFYQGNIDFNENNKLNLMGGYINNAFGASGYYAAPGDKEAFEIVETALFAVGSSHQLSKNFNIRPRVSARYNWDDYRYFRNDLTRARSLHQTGVWSAELNSTLRSTIGDFGFGVESRSEDINSTNIGDRERYNHGAYVEYKTEALKNLLLNIGTYVNYNTQYGWQAFPGLDAAYLFAPKWKLAFNVGSSQRIPSFTDLYLNQRPGNIGNPNLTSENAWQYELSLQYKSDNFNVQGGYFYRNISDFIDWVRNSSAVPYQPQNFGNNKIQGFNVGIGQSINFNSRSNLSYQLSYNYLHAGEMSYASNVTSKYVLENLKHQALGRLIYKYTNWQLTLAGRWIERELKNPYLIADVRLLYGKQNWNVYTEVTNLLNKNYIEVAAVPLPKRWFALGANYRFTL